MANAKRNIGATGMTVAGNLRRLRESQHLTYSAVVKRLDENGHSLQPLSLRRMEEGDRAVDVDDLTALAIAYGVSPVTLLMPATRSGGSTVALTGRRTGSRALSAYEWLRAEAPLPGGSDHRREFSVRANPPWWLDLARGDVERIVAEAVAQVRQQGTNSTAGDGPGAIAIDSEEARDHGDD